MTKKEVLRWFGFYFIGLGLVHLILSLLRKEAE